ncbi:hypothetical protein [Morganella morganii]|uniref:hypothetical protein n=1 Tax=Morganella morganii TaxID=582 RepID=UPI001BDB828E|nr:hypothetical protein [Morganella morganii]MBT0462123.1 hypothetical protein [Morganella morganii subsp. morganii]
MQDLYTLITIPDEGLKKEITIPSGRYSINNTINHEKHLINLNIAGAELLPEKTEAELYENNYSVSFKTFNGELVIQEISYNTPFIFQGKVLFAIKKQQDKWRKNIMLCEKTTNHAALHYLLSVIFLLFIIPATGFMLFQYDSNKNGNPANIDGRNIISQHIKNNNYIINGNDILIFSPDEKSIDIIRNKMPNYQIHTINKLRLKINDSDIILVHDLYHKKKITYIHRDDKKTLLTIPDIFIKDITIQYFSFDDTIKLINNRFSHLLIRYSVKKSGDNIIIYGKKRRSKETDNIIKDINTTISTAPENTLVQYREIPSRDTPPGVYGSVNYIHLSDNHTKFISDNE